MRGTTTTKKVGWVGGWGGVGRRERENKEKKKKKEETTEREKGDDLMNNRLCGNWILTSCRPPRSISSARSIRGNGG